MAFFRKIKAGLVKSEIEEYVGEEGQLFFNVETGELRLGDESTPGGISVGGGGGATLTVSETGESGISNSITNVRELVFDQDTGFNVENLSSGAVKISLNGSFETWKVAGQEDLVAAGKDTIQLVARNGIILTTDTTTDIKTLTISINPDDVSAGKIADIPVEITQPLLDSHTLSYQNGIWTNRPSMYWSSKNW